MDTTEIPVLVDGDGASAISIMRAFSHAKLRQAGAAGLSLEDSCLPKLNSLIGERHPLADVDEFSGRLRAVKDAVGETLILVARIEALIAEHGLNEAIVRSHAYADAGADAILIHSRKSVADEVLSFANKWENRLPVVIVPTTYYRTPVSIAMRASPRSFRPITPCGLRQLQCDASAIVSQLRRALPELNLTLHRSARFSNS
ncbi:2-methylisocitrate lyase-like PEP mutase family enzyme [Bradyrhizobium sp. USDA 4463]